MGIRASMVSKGEYGDEGKYGVGVSMMSMVNEREYGK